MEGRENQSVLFLNEKREEKEKYFLKEKVGNGHKPPAQSTKSRQKKLGHLARRWTRRSERVKFRVGVKEVRFLTTIKYTKIHLIFNLKGPGSETTLP